MWYYIVFSSTHDAMLSQKILQRMIDFEVVPTPPVIDKSCGIALRYHSTQQEESEISKMVAKIQQRLGSENVEGTVYLKQPDHSYIKV